MNNHNVNDMSKFTQTPVSTSENNSNDPKEKNEEFREIEQILKLTEIKRQLDVFCEQMLNDIKHHLETSPLLSSSPLTKQNPDTIKNIQGMIAKNEAQINKLNTEMQNEEGVNNLKL